MQKMNFAQREVWPLSLAPRGDLEVFGMSCLTRVSLFTWGLGAHWMVYANNVISGEGFGSRVISSPSLWAGD